MMMRYGVLRVCVMVRADFVVFMLGGNECRAWSHCVVAEHGCSHRAPEGKQDGQQDQEEDAQVLHVLGLSGRAADWIRAHSKPYF
jgi:hypothetical protein